MCTQTAYSIQNPLLVAQVIFYTNNIERFEPMRVQALMLGRQAHDAGSAAANKPPTPTESSKKAAYAHSQPGNFACLASSPGTRLVSRHMLKRLLWSNATQWCHMALMWRQSLDHFAHSQLSRRMPFKEGRAGAAQRPSEEGHDQRGGSSSLPGVQPALPDPPSHTQRCNLKAQATQSLRQKRRQRSEACYRPLEQGGDGGGVVHAPDGLAQQVSHAEHRQLRETALRRHRDCVGYDHLRSQYISGHTHVMPTPAEWKLLLSLTTSSYMNLAHAAC